MTKKVGKKTKPFICQYCGQGFTNESTILVHSCEKKRRALAKNDRCVKLGYKTYVRFFQITQDKKDTKTYEDFCKSNFYNAFVRFGSFLSNVNPLYPDKYIDWIICSGVKLDHWCREELYYDYVLDLIKKESAETAIKRSIETMLAWADTNNEDWSEYFNKASTSRVVYDIQDGRLSPWLLLNCNSGKMMLNKFADEQLALVFKMLDPDYWSKKFKRFPADVEFVKTLVKESGL